MIPDRIKQRLVKDRRMTSITLRIPVDVVDSLKELAPKTATAAIRPCSSHISAKGCAVTKPSSRSRPRND